MITILSPSKLNLFLHVTGKRTDGYHHLDSLVVFTELSDRLTLTSADHFTFTCNGPYARLINIDDNLVTRAAARIISLHPHAAKIHIHLEKNIPVGGGIGGGSANAAATLNGLNRFFNLDISQDELHEIGLVLGADIPVCLKGTSSHMKGIGEKITPIECPPLFLLLLNPGIHIPTKDIFLSLGHPTFHAEHKNLPAFKNYSDLIAFLKNTRNDLFEAASSAHPILNDIIRIIFEQNGCDIARMSGSGATCFGIFKNEETMLAAHTYIKTHHPNWKSWVTHSR